MIRTRIKAIIISGALVASVLFTPVSVLAQEALYNCGTYGASAYQDNCSEQVPTGGALSDTGEKLPLILAILLLVIGVAGLTRSIVKNRKSSHTGL